MKCHEGVEVKFKRGHKAMWVTALKAETNTAGLEEKTHRAPAVFSRVCGTLSNTHTHTQNHTHAHIPGI